MPHLRMKKPAGSRQASGEQSDMNIRDEAPPEIRIISPRVDTGFTARLSASGVFIAGRISDQSPVPSLRINDSVVRLDENGFFQEYFDLKQGLNVFRLDASDKLSHSTSKFLQVINESEEKEQGLADELERKGEFYGLIIGIDEYRDPGLLDLDNPVSDATTLYSTLIGNYTFDPDRVTLLKNPTRAEIIEVFDKLSNTLTKNDNLLIFYAGHGYWDKEKETGFWLPCDADKFSTVNWIRNSTIQDFIDDIRTKHTLLITDACFAGSIFKSRGAFQDASIAVNKLYSMPSRKAMTSGTLEEVPDRSIFLEFLLKRLNDNDKKYISAGDLFGSFREAVLNNSPNIPQYGVIQDTGDEGGDFIFIKR